MSRTQGLAVEPTSRAAINWNASRVVGSPVARRAGVSNAWTVVGYRLFELMSQTIHRVLRCPCIPVGSPILDSCHPSRRDKSSDARSVFEPARARLFRGACFTVLAYART